MLGPIASYFVRLIKLKNIHREQYDKFDDVFVIPKGDKGKEIDNILTTLIVKLRSEGKLQELHSKVHIPYQDWQPYKMGW